MCGRFPNEKSELVKELAQGYLSGNLVIASPSHSIGGNVRLDSGPLIA